MLQSRTGDEASTCTTYVVPNYFRIESEDYPSPTYSILT